MSEEPLANEGMTLEQMQEMQGKLQSLVKSPGWQVLAEILLEQARLRQNSILTTEEESLKDMISTAKLKSERQGILLAVNLPDTLIRNIKEDIKNAQDEADFDG